MSKKSGRSPAITSFLSNLRVGKTRSAQTLRSYQSDLDQFVQWLETRGYPPAHDRDSLEQVTGLTIRQYLAELERQGYSRSTIARKLSPVRALFRYMARLGLIESDPLRGIRTTGVQPAGPSTASEADLREILELPADDTPSGLRDRAILELLYASGLRVSELVRLNLHTIDFETGWLTAHGHGRPERSVPLGRQALSALSAYVDRGRPGLAGPQPVPARMPPEEQPLFLNKNGTRLSERGVRRILARYGQRVAKGVRLTPLSIRQAFATHLLARGAAVEVVQAMLGHGSSATTGRYAPCNRRHSLRETYLRAHPRQVGSDGDNGAPEGANGGI